MTEREARVSAMFLAKAQDIAAEAIAKAKTEEERQTILHRLATYRVLVERNYNVGNLN